jgi:hypothetical protein
MVDRVLYGAKAIQRRINEIVVRDKPVSVPSVYAWAVRGRLRAFHVGGSLCILEHVLVEDLTGTRPVKLTRPGAAPVDNNIDDAEQPPLAAE